MPDLPKIYDVIIVGSGHAGIEAALSATRLGCETLLLTQNLDTIGQMSCNPAIGGLAKGHLVREIDALGGFMGQNADATGIQFRMLNRTKGPSVRAPRAQCDKKAYQFRAKAVLESTALLDVKQASVESVLVTEGTACGVALDFGIRVLGHSVVVTSGTFLRGLLHVGERSKPGGRMADSASGLSGSLRQLGFEVGRFKTGTPCRVNRHSIDFSQCEIQLGDEPPPRFSFLPLPSRAASDIFSLNDEAFHVEQVPCWITRTTPETHEIIRRNLHRSPLYSGRIKGTGPRYCPSIEDKVVKFADKPNHQIFLEPEGLHSDEFYVNGISTSLPFDVQLAFVRSIPGLQRAEIMRPGYAVEYDFFPPTQLHHTLETTQVSGLYFAGQVNGTSGYEEAAAQGLVAGANAALKVKGKQPFHVARSAAFLGVLIDDLVTTGADEPYRMFTSRAEDRLTLRQDNADQRLTPAARAAGLIDAVRWRSFETKAAHVATAMTIARDTPYEGRRLADWLRQPSFTFQQIPRELRCALSDEIWESVETDVKYEGYVRRQNQHNQQFASRREDPIPNGLEFSAVPGLRPETRQRLAAVGPRTIGEAARVSGVTPADAAILQIWLTKNRRVTASETATAS